LWSISCTRGRPNLRDFHIYLLFYNFDFNLKIQAQKLPDGCLNTFRSISLKVSNAYRQKHASQPMVANQTLDDSAQVEKIC
jgi:hypothetical protein